MSQRTDPPRLDERSEFTPGYLSGLVAMTVLVLVLVFIVTPFIGNPLNAFKIRSAPMPWLYAWVLAAGQTIANGLSEFSGETPGLVEPEMRWAALTSLLLVGVLAPTLCLTLMQTTPLASLSNFRRGFYLLGVIIAGTFSLTVLPTAYIGYNVRMNLRSAQAIQENKDQIINELNFIAAKAHEYAIVPKRLGGGEGSLAGFAVPTSLHHSEQATYTMTLEGGNLDVEAVSKPYEGAKVNLTIDGRGNMMGWEYSGQFQ